MVAPHIEGLNMKQTIKTIKYWLPVVALALITLTMIVGLLYFAWNGKCVKWHTETRTNPFVVGEREVLICERWGL